MKVLAIEDQPVAAMQLTALLRSLGHETELVKNAADAWDRLNNGAYRVVVSDWRMPGIDGLGLCRIIRERGGDYVYFILISSSQITQENRKLAIEAGVDDFLSKPLHGEELSMRLHVAGRIISLTSQVQRLESFLPICGYCKKITDDHKYWQEIETYFGENRGTSFSPSTCPDCAKDTLIPAPPET